jgi:hypothetical protein
VCVCVCVCVCARARALRSAYFISEYVQRISNKFGIRDIHWKLSGGLNVLPSRVIVLVCRGVITLGGGGGSGAAVPGARV